MTHLSFLEVYLVCFSIKKQFTLRRLIGVGVHKIDLFSIQKWNDNWLKKFTIMICIMSHICNNLHNFMSNFYNNASHIFNSINIIIHIVSNLNNNHIVNNTILMKVKHLSTILPILFFRYCSFYFLVLLLNFCFLFWFKEAT